MRTFDFLSPDAVAALLGERVKALRLARNLTQQQLADMAGASLSSVRRLEGQGQATLTLLVRVAQALQVVEQLEPLFDPPVQTIADAEQRSITGRRQRARAVRAGSAVRGARRSS